HGICVAKMLDNTQSIICAFGLAAAAPRAPYRHLELCGIAFIVAHRAVKRHMLCSKTTISVQFAQQNRLSVVEVRQE
ncbi:MAG: hypothetical protein UF620_11090, partial [Gemmiger sp.]|uniref:hypothetical protein n=1 Tax=Gemmiger sp. TaxID=2049027 RepID=UPI002E795BF0